MGVGSVPTLARRPMFVMYVLAYMACGLPSVWRKIPIYRLITAYDTLPTARSRCLRGKQRIVQSSTGRIGAMSTVLCNAETG